jgi:hypothetical protein
MKAFKRLLIKLRIDGDVGETSGMENVSRHDAMLFTNAATREERASRRAADPTTPLRLTAANLMPAENSQPAGGFNGESRCEFDRHVPATTQSQHHRNLHTIGNWRQLSGTSAYEGVRLTIVRGGMQMLRDAANGGLLR